MARTRTVNMSSIVAVEGMPLNADYLLRVKERLVACGAEETPPSFARKRPPCATKPSTGPSVPGS